MLSNGGGSSDGQITNQITSTNHKSFAKNIKIKTSNRKSNHKELNQIQIILGPNQIKSQINFTEMSNF